MATMTRDEIDAYLRGDVTVIEPSQWHTRRERKKTVGEKPYQEHRSREETETLIKNFLADQGKPMTVAPIARALKRTASPHFRAILVDMVKVGVLVESVEAMPNQISIRYLYSLAQK